MVGDDRTKKSFLSRNKCFDKNGVVGPFAPVWAPDLSGHLLHLVGHLFGHLLFGVGWGGGVGEGR